MTKLSTKSKPKCPALSVWELPKLLAPMHRYKKTTSKTCRERPHFRAILAFVNRNRFAVAAQIQRRFSKYLRSDRTARRHLVELEAMGFLGVVDTCNVSPLWPKVYFVTRRGLSRLRQALNDKGQEWTESLRDRRRSEGFSAQHVLHEILTTEFLLAVWESSQACEELEILTTQRRSLLKHHLFTVTMGGRPTRLQPDGMFLYRQAGKGMMGCFVEMDLGTMSLKQMKTKIRRYQAWSESSTGIAFLKSLYQRHGASIPTASHRILLVVACKEAKAEQKRLQRLQELAGKFPADIRNRIRITTVSHLKQATNPQNLLSESAWYRASDGSKRSQLC
ncbi:MAG: replication-relaxation family protein [Planctomycetaceae bacterium]|nr:replication-relaxation family protein [Planctomycetaceae bacterium]